MRVKSSRNIRNIAAICVTHNAKLLHLVTGIRSNKCYEYFDQRSTQKWVLTQQSSIYSNLLKICLKLSSDLWNTSQQGYIEGSVYNKNYRAANLNLSVPSSSQLRTHWIELQKWIRPHKIWSNSQCCLQKGDYITLIISVELLNW